jgi:hypothetical protein
VPSWRDAASAETQADLDGLLTFLVGFAQDQLAKRGALAPCGAAVDVEGKQRLFGAAPPGDTPVIEGATLISMLVEGLRRQRAELRAAGIAYDVRLPQEGRDAIAVDLEHREGQAMSALLPYGKKRFGRGIEYFDLRAEALTPRIWGG